MHLLYTVEFVQMHTCWLMRSGLCACSHLVGHEGKGSVFAVLKRLGWATGLSAGESGLSITSRSFFDVRIDLTDEGGRRQCIRYANVSLFHISKADLMQGNLRHPAKSGLAGMIVPCCIFNVAVIG